jgi:hypothetical protein
VEWAGDIFRNTAGNAYNLKLRELEHCRIKVSGREHYIS